MARFNGVRGLVLGGSLATTALLVVGFAVRRRRASLAQNARHF